MITHPIKDNETVAITGVTNATPVVVTVESNHGMANAETCRIEGVEGTTNANGTPKTVSSVSALTFTLAGVAGNGLYKPKTGTVTTLDAPAREYAADTALDGTARSFPDARPEDHFNFYVDVANDPSVAGDEVDVRVYGRATANSDWYEVASIDENTAGWAIDDAIDGRYVNYSRLHPMWPELRISVEVSTSSTNTVRGWIAV